MHVNTMKTLLEISPETLVPPCMSMIKENFRKPALTMVSEREYKIMCTIDGEVYDQSVYERSSLNTFFNRKLYRTYLTMCWVKYLNPARLERLVYVVTALHFWCLH